MINLKSLPEPIEMMARRMASFIPSSLRMGNAYWRLRKFLSDSDRWSEEEIRNYQFEELKKILTHAYERTAWYRKIFDAAGVNPEHFRKIEDITKYPFIHREDIRDQLEELSADVPSYKVKSSGSTGVPLEFYYDRESRLKERAFVDHYRSWMGDNINFKHLILLQRSNVQKALGHFKYVPFPKMLICSPNHMSPERMEVFYHKVLEYKPKFIECYPSSGAIFAKFLKETGRKIDSVKGIFCQSENLYNWQKDLMEEVFNARVSAFYGLCELAAFAGYCEKKDEYHVFPQYAFTELIDEKGNRVSEPGQVGEIVGTSFIIKATPFIRYRTRDFAKLKGYKCRACGRPYQVWERIEGRLQDMVLTKTGRYLNMLDMYDNVYDGVKLFQFYQDAPGNIVFCYIPEKADLSGTQKNKIIAGFKHRSGPDVDFEMRRVENISRTNRGKYRFLEQKLKLNYGDSQE